MSLPMRYLAALGVVILYYAHAWVPLFSVTRGSAALGPGGAGLSFLQASSGFEYHYLTIGVMPFVMGGLVVQLIRWQMPSLYRTWTHDDPTADRLGRKVAYVFGAGLAYSIVHGIAPERMEYGAWVVFVELMLTITSVDQLLKLLKPLAIVSSPTMLFLGINVISAAVHGYGKLSYASFDENSWIWLGVSVFLMGLTVAVAVASSFWCTQITACTNTIYGTIAKKIPFKVLRAGVTPMIYATYLLYLPLTHRLDVPPSQWVVEQIWPAIVLGLLLFVLTRPLNAFTIQSSDLRQYANARGVMLFVDNTTKTHDPSDILEKTSQTHARMSALFFVMLVVVEGAWLHYAPPFMHMPGVVGGISWILLWGVLQDIHYCLQKLRSMKHYE